MMRGAGQQPIIVLSQGTKRESGHQVQIGNITACKTIADVIRTSLGPRAMLKMLMDPMGGIVMTNDGNAILREITVKHPAAKSMIEIARTQDEETGDGTTSVIVLAGEVMAQAQQFLEQKIHPTIIIQAYRAALEDMIKLAEEKYSRSIDVNNDKEITSVVKSCLGTKMLSKWMDLAVQISLDAVKTIRVDKGNSSEIDIKRYCRIEKIPGGTIEDCRVIKGVVLNKVCSMLFICSYLFCSLSSGYFILQDVTHAKMRRRIEHPRIVLLDCNLEYKKGESQTSLEIMKEEDISRILEQEEESIRKQCDEIISVKPDLVFTEKGVSDLAQHFLLKAGITAIRRLKKTDNNRLARVCGARIVNDTTDLRESDVGTQADLFEILKIGDEYYTYVTSEKTTACTICLRGPSKDVINEVERNLQDSLHVVRNIMLNPRLVPGGGALEMALAQAITEKGKSMEGVRQWPYKAIARALELTALRAKHAQNAENWTWGINGTTGELIMLLRIDDIVSGTKKTQPNGPQEEMPQ
ncbi:T-complex protein 1, gamma subunit [Ostertagia ostertagi]